jgi:hypothetical protein
MIAAAIVRALRLAALLALTAATMAPAQPAPQDYAAGQVWAYRTRAGEEGSLLRIQQVEQMPGYGPIYHISVIGIRLGNAGIGPGLPHMPVSRETLDASVTRQVVSRAEFPSATEGIAQWREAQGGVFTIPLAEIIASVDQMLSESPQ